MKQVYLIGDSIRMGYGPQVRALLRDVAGVDYPGENCRFTLNTLCFLHTWAEQLQGVDPEQIDLVHWNNGLWDVCHFMGDPEPLTSPALYRETLARIAHRIRVVFPRARIAFALTTGVNERRAKLQQGVMMRTNAQIAQYNRIAREVMESLSIPVNPLDAVAAALPDSLREDWVHYTPEGYMRLASQVAGFIRAML